MEFTRLRFLAAYSEQSTDFSANFLRNLTSGMPGGVSRVECIRTDNGFEFTNRFSNSQRDIPTVFERTAAQLPITHKLIRPYTRKHNGKVERSHHEDQNRFYPSRFFFSWKHFQNHPAVHSLTAVVPISSL